MSTAAFSEQLLAAYRLALAQALPPKPQVARHWERPDRLTWLALACSGDAFAFAYSLGTLKGTPLVPGERHTAGVFALDDRTFPGVGSPALARRLSALVPPGDGATRAFLQRVLAQVTVARVARSLQAAPAQLPLAPAPDFAVSVVLRPDALGTPAPTPRLPPHARERVLPALTRLEPDDAALLQGLFDAPEDELVLALGGLLEGRRGAARA